MPHSLSRMCFWALLLASTGCASSNFFAGLSQRNKSESSSEQIAARENRQVDQEGRPRWTAQPDFPAENAGQNNLPLAKQSSADLLAASEQHRRDGNLSLARMNCEQAIQLEPQNLEARYQWARIADDEGRFADAEKAYISLLNQRPGDLSLLTSLGWSYYLQGRFDDSKRCLQEVLTKEPNNTVALNNMGFVLGARGDLDGAWNCFRSAGTEAQAREAMAMVTQNLRSTPADQQVAIARGRDVRSEAAPRSDVVHADAIEKAPVNEPKFASKQAKKIYEDYQRLKAEQLAQEKQQASRKPRPEAQRPSSPSPWNRQVVANSSSATREGQFTDGRENRGLTSNQYSADRNGVGVNATQHGYAASSSTDLDSISSATPDYTPNTQLNNQAFAPLPSQNANSLSSPLPEWPDQPSPRAPNRVEMNSTGRLPESRVAPAGASRSAGHWQDSQTAAAQVGLNAGPGSFGASFGDLSDAHDSPTGASQVPGFVAPGGNPMPPPAKKFAFRPPEEYPSAQAPATLGARPVDATAIQRNGSTPNNAASRQNLWPAAVQYQGVGSGSLNSNSATQNQNLQGNSMGGPSSGTAPLPKHPLSYPVVAPAVVPSAQGRVYGSSDESPLVGGMQRFGDSASAPSQMTPAPMAPTQQPPVNESNSFR